MGANSGRARSPVKSPLRSESRTFMASLARPSLWPRYALMALVHAYRWTLKPWLGSACRFEPTCSAYALEALRRHGALTGSALTGWRLVRCHPWCNGGVDPVPESLPDPLRARWGAPLRAGPALPPAVAEPTPKLSTRLADPTSAAARCGSANAPSDLP
jgi:putative membrane protein insertion efficiency factor